jgi:hypothetical protein
MYFKRLLDWVFLFIEAIKKRGKTPLFKEWCDIFRHISILLTKIATMVFLSLFSPLLRVFSLMAC